jgi:hypothetical protein
MKRTLAVLVPVAAAVIVAVSGCGASNVTGDAVANAAVTTSSHGSKIAMTMTMSSAALSQPLHMTASGVKAQGNREAEINVDMSDLASALGGSGIKASQLQATEILQGTTFYMRMPLLDGKLPDHKKWIKIDIAKAGTQAGINLGSFMQPGQDPTQQLGYLRTVSNAKKVGTDTIRGVQTTHYHGVVQLSSYPRLLPAAQRAAARQTVQKLIEATGTSSYPIDVWVDKDKLVRRVHFLMNMKIPQGGQSMKMDIQEDLYDFGTPVNITPPSDSDVYDATSATSNALKQSGLGG